VGIFDAGNTGFSSEIWGDVDQVMQAFRRPVYSSLIFKLNNPAAFPAAKTAVETDPRLTLEAKRETRYYLDQSEIPPLELKKLEAIFRHKVFRMLLDKGRLTQEMIAMLSSWRHSGFDVFCGNRISPDDDTAMENLARYIIRASFSQERMQYLDEAGTVVYTSKDGETTKNFPALEWLAAMCSHIPNRGEQMVKYYGYYSNVSRRKRRQEGLDNAIPCILEPQGNEKAFRKSWSRLIQKIGACPGESRENRSPGLPEMSGDHADYQFHRGSVGDPGYPQSSWTMAGKGKATAKSSHPMGT